METQNVRTITFFSRFFAWPSPVVCCCEVNFGGRTYCMGIEHTLFNLTTFEDEGVESKCHYKKEWK